MSTYVVPHRCNFVSSISLSIAQWFAESNSGCSARVPASRHLWQIVIQRTFLYVYAVGDTGPLDLALLKTLGSVPVLSPVYALTATLLRLHAKQIVTSLVHAFVFSVMMESIKKSVYAVENA